MLKKTLSFGCAIAIAATMLIDSDWEVSHEVVIDAEVGVVWELLVDAESYPEWNRYSPKIEGRIAEGEVIWLQANLDNEVRRVKNTVISVVRERELCWQSGGWYGYLARGTRCRWLSETASGKTRLVHHEIMSGPLAWLIEWRYRDRIERGIALVDNSVAERAESLTAELARQKLHRL